MNNQKSTKQEMLKEVALKAMEIGKVEVEIREGEALELKHPIRPLVRGRFTTPSEYMKQRQQEFTIEKSLAIFDVEARTIELESDTRDHYSVSIIGSLKESMEWGAIGVNQGKKWRPEELSKFLRLRRSWFENVADHAGLVSQLRNIKAKINKMMEENSDLKGNRTENYNVAVESNLPESFKLKIPVFKGMPPVSFTVEFVVSGETGELIFELESVEAQENIDALVENLFKTEEEIINKLATVIYK